LSKIKPEIKLSDKTWKVGAEIEREKGEEQGCNKKRLGPKACSFFLRGGREMNYGIVIFFLFLYSLISNLICCTGNCNAFCLMIREFHKHT